ncbi:MAG: competence protein ComEC [Patescibacteria group bacterium]|nr:competence protein ComEC [Patescibacteria group bacterium]
MLSDTNIMVNFKKTFFLLLILGNIFNWWLIITNFKIVPAVSFLEVGQGDAELIQTVAGNILIDTGPSNKILFALGEVLPFNDKTLDLVILSHPNKDHYNGLFDLLEQYHVRAVLLNNLTYPSSTFQKLIEELKKKGIPLIKGEAGVNISWQTSDSLKIIFPPADQFFNLNSNASGIVALLSLARNQVLFPGDINFSQEQKIVPFLKNLPLGTRILKVSHHGSSQASSQAFLETFKPELAIIEVGENSYGQPSPEALERLKEVGAKVLRTDLNGTIKLFIDKEGILRVK